MEKPIGASELAALRTVLPLAKDPGQKGSGSADLSVDELAQNFQRIMRRYGQGAKPEAFIAVLCPLLVKIESLDKTVKKLPGQSHWRASFTMRLSRQTRGVLVRGRTGKFVPGDYGAQGAWREIAKGRVISVNAETGVVEGEVYTGGPKGDLVQALAEMSGGEYLEIDQYGAAAKVLSGLAEFELVRQGEEAGYLVKRMPEDMARHLGIYANYDFEFEKSGVTKKVEVKSLWGTNTRFSRLIHSTTTPPPGPSHSWSNEQKQNYYPTSSCKFSTQDIFAVSLFLRTGNIGDFAFARSVPRSITTPHGLLTCSGYPDHVNQNPTCEIGDGSWFRTIDEVWDVPTATRAPRAGRAKD